MTFHSTDILVIGAGAAGIRAALAASEAGVDVVVTAKRRVTDSGATFSPISRGWGIQALVGIERTDRNLAQFYDEIVQVGLGKCDTKLVQILVEASGDRFEDLLSYGIRFRNDSLGKPIRVKGCFSDVERAFVTEDYDNVRKTFENVLKRSRIRFLRGSAIDLITAKDSCWGAWLIADDQKILQVNARSTILATGGGASIFRNSLAGDTGIGAGYALASRAGVQLKNLEYIQFMLAVKTEPVISFLPLSALTTRGALLDEAGDDILKRHIPNSGTLESAISCRQGHFPFSCRDASYHIDVAVAKEVRNGKGVFYRPSEAAPPSEVVHASHAFNGGVEINEKAESSLTGLFAAGEVAAGPHGADRIGGCMMTATQVFGRIAGHCAALRAKRIRSYPKPNENPKIFIDRKHRKNRNRPYHSIRKAAKKTVGRHLMIPRSNDGLVQCRKDLTEMENELSAVGWETFSDLKEYWNLKLLICTGLLVLENALKNRSSEGSHFRIDTS